MNRYYLSCDLGAESGRVILGRLEGDRLELQELHRFHNGAVQEGESLHWNTDHLLEGVVEGLKKAGRIGISISSVSCDSWGVDYLLFDEAGQIISPTFHYRDPRTARGVEVAFRKTDWPSIFKETGIQFMPLNTLFQLTAESDDRLNRAGTIMGIGDGFNFLLGGKACIEVSMASTFQLYNPVRENWSEELIRALGFPRRIFPPIVPSGTPLGRLGDKLAEVTGLGAVEVVASCSHDTGAAVAAVPTDGSRWGYISSGTWSLMGVEVSEPVMNDRCRDLNFTNEAGYGGSIRLLKNISGLWLVQECRRHWAEEGNELDYGELTRFAADAPAFRSLVDPTDPLFTAPGDMPDKIASFCRRSGQAAPESIGQTVRCALESLTCLYRRTRDELEQLLGWRIQTLYIVGGGSRNELLNNFTADALEVPVSAGPIEATAAGNVMVQAIGLGHVPSLAAGRKIISESFPTRVFEPGGNGIWDDAYARFLDLAAQVDRFS